MIQDIRYALRMLARNPGFTAVAVLALALGIGANTAVFTVLNGALLRPLRFSEPDRLFLLSYAPLSIAGQPVSGLVDRDYLEFRQRARSFETVAAFSNRPVSLTGGGDPVRVPGANVTTDFFAMLRVNPAMGRTFLAGDDHVVLLSDKLWRKRFAADPQVIGKNITVDGAGHTVIGVLPAGFLFPYDAELWTPLEVRTDPHNSWILPVAARLKPGVSVEQARAELESIGDALASTAGGNRRNTVARILPLQEMLVGDIRKSLLIFAGAVAFVLLIACANVANLMLMRAASRQHEVAVRSALGAGRRRLIAQLLTESTLVALCGGAAGLLLALWGVPALLALAPTGRIPRIQEIHVDRWVLAFTFGVSLLTGAAFGLAPALRMTRSELRESLSRGARTVSGRHEGLRSALVVGEVALALILLTGAGLMLKSFLRMRAVNTGFRAENVLTMTVDLPEAVYRSAGEMREFSQRMLPQLASLPGVLSAGAVNWMPLSGMAIRGNFHLTDDRRMPRGYLVSKLSVSPDYFRALGIRILGGRDFSARDNAGAPGVVVISQSVARRFWPGEDPLGKLITLEDHPKPEDWVTIVGVVEDVRQYGLRIPPVPAIYQPYLQVNRPGWLGHMTFVVRTAATARGVAAAMRAALREVDKDLPVQSIISMSDVVARTTAEPLFQTRLLGAFSLLALALAAIGIYGVLAYSVAERTHEIGIRMALGAQARDVMRMVLRRTLALALTGVALGTAGALGVTRVLEKFLFEVKPTDRATFIAVAVALAAVALAAGWMPARRATQVDPLVALRYE